jgi:hypothetical protein
MLINLVSNKEVISVVSNYNGTAHTITVRDKTTGRVVTEVIYGQLPGWVKPRV